MVFTAKIPPHLLYVYEAHFFPALFIEGKTIRKMEAVEGNAQLTSFKNEWPCLIVKSVSEFL